MSVRGASGAMTLSWIRDSSLVGMAVVCATSLSCARMHVANRPVAVVRPAPQQSGVPEQARAPVETDARPLRVLFLGHAQERHHPSSTLLPLLAVPLASRGIQLTHVMTPEEALTPAKLAHYDALMIYANHKTITPEQEQALLDFVEGGKGVVAIHCASFMFIDSPRYIPMIGGQFLR